MIKEKYKLNVTSLKTNDLRLKYDNSTESYVYRFPVYSYKNQPLIFCILRINVEGNISFNVIDANGDFYSQYYNDQYGENHLCSIIDIAIEKELKRLGAKRIKIERE